MREKFRAHDTGYRSPTEQQLIRWETDGGNYFECMSAYLFDGRLYSCKLDLFRAQLSKQLKSFVQYFYLR